MAIAIERVDITPNPVSADGRVIISVTIVTHQYLGKSTHHRMGTSTHFQLKGSGGAERGR